MYELCGSIISSKVTLHSIVALLTTKPKYMEAKEVVKEAIWLKGLVGDLGLQ